MARAAALVLAVLALLAQPAAAQPPWEQAAELRAQLTGEIERRLRATEPDTVAWGAFEAGGHLVPEAVHILPQMRGAAAERRLIRQPAPGRALLPSISSRSRRAPSGRSPGFAWSAPVRRL